MVIAKYQARVNDVKAAFLKDNLENNKEIYLKVAVGFEKFYPKQNTGSMA